MITGIRVVDRFKFMLSSENGDIKIMELYFAMEGEISDSQLNVIHNYHIDGKIHDLQICNSSIFLACQYDYSCLLLISKRIGIHSYLGYESSTRRETEKHSNWFSLYVVLNSRFVY